MKQKFEIEIDAGIDRVWAAFTDPENMRRWVRGFRSFRTTAGEPGQPGATAEVVFEEKGREVVMTETITERREQAFLAGTYEADHGTTLIVNQFEAIDPDRTRWTSWCNFTFTGFTRYLSIFIAGAVRRRTEGDMARFKLMVESDLADAR